MRILILMTTFFMVYSPHIFANAAKAIIVRGDVKIEDQSGSYKTVSRDQWVQEGQRIVTGERSIVKLLFKDNSKVSLGPKSSMVIKTNEKSKAGFVELIKGQIRSQISKDPLTGEKKKGGTKFYFRTKTAAIGVRGTELHLSFNQQNERTILISYTGEVVMANVLQADIGSFLETDRLENLLNTDEAVSVKEGFFSEAGPDRNRASLPVKVSPSQFRLLRGNQDFKEKQTQDRRARKESFGNVLPPGVNPRDFVNENTSEDSNSDEDDFKAPPEGLYEADSGKYAPPAGGFIDFNTSLYIAPPPGSLFDPVTKVFIPPANFGTFDPATGIYVLPAGYKLNSNGVFVPDGTIRFKKKKGKKAPVIITPKLLKLILSKAKLPSDLDFVDNFVFFIQEKAELQEVPETEVKNNSALKFTFTVE